MDKWIPAIFLLFLGLGIFLPWFRTSKPGEFVLLSRKLTIWPFVATLVATSYGWVLGIGEMYDTYGPAAWLILSFPYTAFSLLLAFGPGKKIRTSGAGSVPELLGKSFGLPFSILVAVLLLLFLSPAMYFLMTARILQAIWPMSTTLSLVLSVIISVVYLFGGGFKSVVNSDKIQFALMFGGFGLMSLWFLIHPAESLDLSQTPHHYTSLTGYEIIFWLSAAAITLADPNYHQRIQALQKPEWVRKGMIYSALFWTLFDAMAIWVVWQARILYPDTNGGDLLFLNLLQGGVPKWLAGIWGASLLAITISTANSFTFTGSQSIHQDIWRHWPIQHASKKILRGKWAIFIFTIFSTWMAWLFSEDSMVNMFYTVSPVVLSVVLIPLFMSLYLPTKITDISALFAGLVITFCTLSWSALKLNEGTGINAFVFGVSISLFVYGGLYIFARRKS